MRKVCENTFRIAQRRCFLHSDVSDREAKVWGYHGPYGSYWIVLSGIMDGVDENITRNLVMHVEKWSQQHSLLKPRHLHLLAELAGRSDAKEVLHQRFILRYRRSNCSIKQLQRLNACLYWIVPPSSMRGSMSGPSFADVLRCGRLLKQRFGQTSRVYTGYIFSY